MENCGKSICILARKRLFRNTRVVRQAKALEEAGFDVTVVAIELPSPELRALTPKARYIEVTLNPWPQKVLKSLNFIKTRLFGIKRRNRMRTKRLINKIRLKTKKLYLVIRKPYGMAKILWGKIRFRYYLIFEKQGSPPSSQSGRINNKILRVFLALLFFCFTFFHRLSVTLKFIGDKVVKIIRQIWERPKQGLKNIINHIKAFNNRRQSIIENKFRIAIEQSYQYVRGKLLPFMNDANTLSFARKAYKATAGFRFDLCQAHDTHSLLAAKRIAAQSNAKLLYDALEIPDDRSGPAAEGVPKWLRWLENRREERIIRSADLVFAVGPALAEWTEQRYDICPPVLIRNCCLYKKATPNDQIRQDLGLKNHERIGIVVGSIYRDQGLEQLIEAICFMAPAIHIVAIGPVAQIDFIAHLKRHMAKHKTNGRFHILEPQPPEKLLSYLSGADIGIIARQNTCLNNQYCLPNKIFELIMARLPIVSSKLPNIVSIIEEYNIGKVFDEKNPKNIAKAINEILAPTSLEKYKQSVERAAEKLCWENEARLYIKTIENMNHVA